MRPRMNVAKDILAAQRGDPAVVREPRRYRPSFVVVVDCDRIGKSVLDAPVEDFLGQRVEFAQRAELAQRATAPAAVFPIPFAPHPAIVPAIADDIDLLDVIHPDVVGEHGPVDVP